jgi:hypothetical protein
MSNENASTPSEVSNAWDIVDSIEGDGLPASEGGDSGSPVAWDDSVPEEAKPNDEPEDLVEEPEAKPEVEQKAEGEDKPTTKLYKAKFGDKIVEFPDNATIKIKANSKFITPTFRDLKDNYAGKVAWDEKLETLTQTRKEFESEVTAYRENLASLDSYVKQIHKSATEGDIFAALTGVSNLVDIDPNSFIEAFHKGFEKYFEEYVQLSEQDKEFLKIKRQKEIAENTLKEKLTKEQTQNQVVQVQKQIKVLQEKFGVTDEEMRLSYKAIEKQRNGDMNGVTPEHLVQLSLDGRILDNIYSVSEESDLKLERKDIEYLFDVIKAEQKKGGVPLSEVDYREIVEAYLGEQAKPKLPPVVDQASAEAVNRKVQRSNQPTKVATPVKQEQALDLSGKSVMDLWNDAEEV